MSKVMMTSELSEVLELRCDEVRVEPGEEYRTVGVRSFGRGLFARPAVSGSTSSYSKLYRLHVNQVVLSRLFAWEGAVALVPPEFDGWFVSPEFPTFNVSEGRAIPAYVGHFLSWGRFQESLAGATRGLGQRRQRVHAEDFLKLRIPLLPLDEQQLQTIRLDSVAGLAQAIADRLGSDRSPSFIGILPNLVDGILHNRAIGKAAVRDLAEFISDTVHPGDDPGPAGSFVGLQHIESHTGRRLGSDPLGLMKGRKFRFQPGDVVFGYLRPYLNKVWLADRHGLCSVDQYVLRPRAGVDGSLLAYSLRGREILTQAVELTHTLQLPRLRSGLLASLEVPVFADNDVPALIGCLDSLRDRTVKATGLRAREHEVVAALLPSALNEVFSDVAG